MDVTESIAGNPVQTDEQLLRAYVELGDQGAFTELVQRHMPRVYAAARWQLRDEQLAQDVVQAVFIVLANKAKTLKTGVILPAWLHRVTTLCALDARRRVRRRRHHETEAAKMKSELPASANPDSEDLLSKLSVAVGQLSATDRDAVVLRFFQSKSLAEVGRILRISESGATKRVSRALLKLRAVLTRRGKAVTSDDISQMLSVAPPIVPLGLAAHIAKFALSASTGSAGGLSAAVAKSAMRRFSITKATFATIILAAVGWVTWSSIPSKPKQNVGPAPVATVAKPAKTTRPLPDQMDFRAVPVVTSTLTEFPYAPGWPMAVPGAVFCTPALADLEGNGKLDIVVTCGPDETPNASYSHPKPSPLPMIFAFHPDGTPVPGWPVQIGTARQARPPHSSPWACDPSVFRGRDGRDHVVVRGPGGASTYIFDGDGSYIQIPTSNPAASIPLADFNNSGVMAFSVGKSLATVEGGPVPGWPANRKFTSGFAPCVGDALGDGQLKCYQLYYTHKNDDMADIVGFDSHGNQLPGWPHQVQDPTWKPPVMGDVIGDGKMEVICAGVRIHAWTWDGKPLPNTKSTDRLDGILKENVVQATASPSLADLDGDGVAEIIIFDQQSHCIRAWHGDGRPLDGSNFPASPDSPDGVIAALPGVDGHGVSVVSLGDDPSVMDFFVATYWVRRFCDGHTIIRNMVPGQVGLEWAQPTIADVEGNGKADVVFGVSDGRLIVYRTGLAYHADRMQWATAQGNFQRTGVWKASQKK